MSLTRKCLDREHLMSKLEQVKLDISGELIKSSLAQTVKRDPSNRKSKSREKTVKALPERTGINTAEVDDTIWGCSTQKGTQGGDLGRMAVLVHRVAAAVDDHETGMRHLAFEILARRAAG